MKVKTFGKHPPVVFDQCMKSTVTPKVSLHNTFQGHTLHDSLLQAKAYGSLNPVISKPDAQGSTIALTTGLTNID